MANALHTEHSCRQTDETRLHVLKKFLFSLKERRSCLPQIELPMVMGVICLDKKCPSYVLKVEVVANMMNEKSILLRNSRQFKQKRVSNKESY